MIDVDVWRDVRRLFASAFASSLHFSVASVGGEGEPWVTPVGSVLLGEPGHAYYFEMYTQRLGARLAANPRVCVMAVDSGKRLWLDALVRARFARLPAVCLMGRAEPMARTSTGEERQRMFRRIRGVRRLRGGRRLWPSLDCPVRELRIDRIEPVRLGGLEIG